MALSYTLMDPTGNRTILVEQPVDPAQQPGLAAGLLAAEPTAEQVGFLGPGDGESRCSLRMAGGEFCGNASMSAAVLWCQRQGVDTADVPLRVSGAAEPVWVEVCPDPAADAWQGTVTMPPAAPPRLLRLPLEDRSLELPLVDLGGICHLVLEQPLERARAETAIRRWCALLEAPALGLMQLDRAAGRLTPLVYVPGGDTLYWEHSCASGSAAVGCWLAWQAGRPVEVSLAQPGGSLWVSATPAGRVRLRGRVRILHQGCLHRPDSP